MIAIDYQDRRPIYEQIVEKYERLIVSGVLAPDEQLPSVRQMAQELSINPNTIQKAYSILEKDGYIYTVRGRGNFVNGNEDVSNRKKKIWEEKLVQLLREGRELGIERERMTAIVQQEIGGAHD
ncbi:MAG: GntR family transcriptional regulator [Eubacteriales bacterium]|nr:GntR family transcriptional regulator [Eubacteriales bacterium]